MYPIPTGDILNISHERNTLDILRIIDIAGRVLLKETDFRESYINVSSLKAGVYFLKVTDEGKTFILRFIKK